MNVTNKEAQQVLEVEVFPIWENIRSARQACDGFFSQNGFSEEHREAVCMVASELLENAVKYGHFPDGTGIHLRAEVRNRLVTVEVESPLNPREMDNVRRLDDFVQWIRGYQSPFQAYLERMKAVAVQPIDSDESGLGLVRIAYEGDAILDFYVTGEEVLHVSAIFPFERK